MHLFFLHMLAKGLETQPDEHIPGAVHQHPHDTTEGSEFLDDAIRMIDQPLSYTTEDLPAAPDNENSYCIASTITVNS